MQGEQTPLSATTWKVIRISRSGRSFERYAAAIYLRRCRHRPPAPGLQGIVHFNRRTRPTGSAQYNSRRELVAVPAFDGNARSAGVEITYAGRRSRFAFLLQREPERRHIVVAQIRGIRHVIANRRTRHDRDRTSTHRNLQRRRELYVRPGFRPGTRLSGLHRRRHTSKSAAGRPTSAGRGSRQTRLASGIVGWRFGQTRENLNKQVERVEPSRVIFARCDAPNAIRLG